MQRRHLSALAASVIAASVAVAVVAWPAQGHSYRQFHFFEAFPSSYGAEVDATGNKRRVGDYLVFHTQVRDGKATDAGVDWTVTLVR